MNRTVLLLVGLVVVLAIVKTTMARPDPAQIAAMTDAIKALQLLDKYYSQNARPSTRSDASFASPRVSELSQVRQAIKMLRLQQLDRLYSHRARPRFGKRSDTLAELEDGYDQGDDGLYLATSLFITKELYSEGPSPTRTST